jgi:type I restriction enzyme S subunit
MCARIFIPARFKRSYAVVDEGVPYLLPSQLTILRPHGMKAITTKQASASPEYLLDEGELLISTDGTVGRVHPVTRRMKGWFGSNNLARLNDKATDMGYLCAFLSTPYGYHQIRKDIYGGVVDHITEVHIGTVLVPKASSSVQKRIGDAVREAYELKDRANELEDEAIRQLENIIEEPPNVTPTSE